MIVPARECHVCQMLVAGIRQEDLNEMKAASGLPPEVSLPRCLSMSTKAWACVDKRGLAYAVCGVAPWSSEPSLGSPWLIATDSFVKHRVEVVRNTKRFVHEMGEGFEFLINYTDLRHTNNLSWLEWAGFRFDGFIPHYGAERRPFLRFSKAT